jgi:uncharacterized OB-fold protein
MSLTPPVVDEVSQPYWDGCLAGELRMQACGSCGRLRFPPRPMCPWCRSVSVEWPVMSGTGTVWSVAVPHPPLLPAYAEVAPYNVVVVELDEDPTLRLVGNVVATPNGPLNEVDPHSIAIGDRVRVVFADPGPPDGVSMPRWVRAG